MRGTCALCDNMCVVCVCVCCLRVSVDISLHGSDQQADSRTESSWGTKVDLNPIPCPPLAFGFFHPSALDLISGLGFYQLWPGWGLIWLKLRLPGGRRELMLATQPRSPQPCLCRGHHMRHSGPCPSSSGSTAVSHSCMIFSLWKACLLSHWASLFLSSFPASVCVPSPFCGCHGVSLLLHTLSLPPRAERTQDPPLSPSRKARDLLVDILSSWPPPPA